MGDSRPTHHSDQGDAPILRALLQFGSVQRIDGKKLDAILELLQPAAGAQEG